MKQELPTSLDSPLVRFLKGPLTRWAALILLSVLMHVGIFATMNGEARRRPAPRRYKKIKFRLLKKKKKPKPRIKKTKKKKKKKVKKKKKPKKRKKRKKRQRKKRKKIKKKKVKRTPPPPPNRTPPRTPPKNTEARPTFGMSKSSMAKGKGKAGFRRGNTLMMEPDKNPPKRVEPYVVPRRREPPPPRPIPFTPVPLFEITENPQEWKKVSATYPADAKRDGITAVVVLSVAIRRNGRVRWAKVVSIRPPQAKRYDFGRAAVKALRRYRFRPAKLKGKPVDVIVRYIYRFELDD